MDPEQLTVVHDLFNRLHAELVSLIDPNKPEGVDITQGEAQVAALAFKLDAMHHDFANITLAKDPA